MIPDVLSSVQIEGLRVEAERASGGNHALRGLLDLEWARELTQSRMVRRLVEDVLGKRCFAVRGIFFDKIPGANWLVPPHQDLSIAVEEKGTAEGFGPWSRKDDVVHVQPPSEVLERMVTVRLHLDECDESNGALRVVAGSHQLGKLQSEEAYREARKGETTVPVPEGGAMLFRPLLVHASSPSVSPSHRRVVHLEFAVGELLDGLKWRWRVGGE